MYDSFDNTYQATIGIDFLSKVRQIYPAAWSTQNILEETERQPYDEKDGQRD